MTEMITKADFLKQANAVVTLAEFARKVQKDEEVPMVWLQWECTERSLPRRAIMLAGKVVQIANSKRLDADKLAVGFLNTKLNSELQAYLDEFVLYDAETGEIQFRIVPYRKEADKEERAFVYQAGNGNSWKKPVIRGSWPDVRKWFTAYSTNGATDQKPVASQIKGPRNMTQIQLPKTVKARKAVIAQMAGQEAQVENQE